LMASGLTILASSFQEVCDHLGFVCACLQEGQTVYYTRHRQPYPDRGRRKMTHT
jgi:hypothetical protein